MKKVIKILGVNIIVLLIVSCSSVKVTDSWKDNEVVNLVDKKVLVLSKSKDDLTRKQFEIDLVDKLEENNINSVESFKLIPKVDVNDSLTKSEIDELKRKYIEKGIDVVIMTVLKDTQEFETTTTTGGSNYYFSSYPVYYRRGFYRSYHTIYMDSSPSSYTTSKGKRFILETIVYDLNEPENEQLLSVITTKIENPETLGTTSKDFSKKVIKELIK
ncbi:hypothetical protein A9Q87_02640 [Flavobacteriales bacterium 34_180_T64]|nr:hypothetical protein A9Q87_02640 [Flavobacteriales bacterium 34_180_T64]